ncbi:hypothetical protein [Luteolibacter sp. Populi]|uniref:hypothetical protein n=1 Tax=Luteolibacter sp. Populi TaxID=3230487 RepID=UPI003465D189
MPIGALSLLAGILAPLAHSAQVVQAGPSDVILAFRHTGSLSSTGSYLVDAGPVSQFLNASPGSTTVVAQLGPLSADLEAYDSTTVEGDPLPWHASKFVVWSAFGVNFTDNQAVYISRPRPSIAVKSDPYGPRNGYQQLTAYGEITSVITQGYNVLTASPGNPRGSFQTTVSSPAPSYLAQVATNGQSDFGTWPNIEKDFNNGAAASALDFYVHRKGAAISDFGTVGYLGYFTISQSGVVSFTANAVDPFTIDSDGDGSSDGDEEVAGTNPLNATSFFKLALPVVVQGTSTTFTLPTIASRKYVIEYNDDLAGAWEEVHVHLSGAGATPLNFVDTAPARINQNHGFYRAKVTLP